MAGLVGYASSDEESDGGRPQAQLPAPPKQTQAPPPPLQPAATVAPKSAAGVPKPQLQAQPQEPPAPGAPLPPPGAAAPLGPSLPSTEASSFAPLPEPTDLLPSSSTPSPSPYTTTRALIHDLTLPAIPNLDLPPSSSPPPSATATEKKCAHFLKLKRAGTHFNARLEQSTLLRNPALTDKLLGFVEVDGKRAQYETTLMEGVWDPGAFPDWAFRDGLRRARDKVAREREAARAAPGRTSVEFVSATTVGAVKGEKRKGVWQ